MKQTTVLLLLLLFTTACGQAVVQPTPTPVPTETPSPTVTPQPTPTETPIPLAELDLEPLLVQSGDLPAGVTGAQVRHLAPGMFDEVPAAQNTIYQEFAYEGETAGGVSVFLYDDPGTLEQAYSLILDGFTDDETVTTDEVGERAAYVRINISAFGITMNAADLLFSRCNAVVHIRITTSSDPDVILSYGRRLDQRLQPVVCR